LERSRYDQGEQASAEVRVPSVADGVKFYTELFGWDSAAMGADAGHYTMFSKEGKPVAALRGAAGSGPAEWLTYFSVQHLDAVSHKVEDAGGTLVIHPTDIPWVGQMAVFVDTTGATAAAWQPGGHFGAALRSEEGAYIASELGSSDLAKSKEFYSEVFDLGWGGRAWYPEGLVDGRFVLGVLPAEKYADLGRPSAPYYWLVYFAANDVEGVVRKAASLGATVRCDTRPNQLDRQYAIVRDPQGATFGLNTR
jgi:uncharacterized protein